MTRYEITRARGNVMSICETCGDTSGPQRREAAILYWQRKHTAAHRAQEGRRLQASAGGPTHRETEPAR